jgi:hypothetical protein
MSTATATEIVRRKQKEYRRSSKGKKGQILDEITKLTGYHRGSLQRMFTQADKPKKEKERKGRASKYAQVLPELKVLWAASFYSCGKRLKPFIPELLSALKRFGEVKVTPEEENLLTRISAATIDRQLAKDRAGLTIKGKTTTKPGTLLRSQIPVRTFAEWNENEPGFFEADLVAHCGASGKGEFLYTLTMTDILTGWTVLGAMKGRGERGTLEAMHTAWEDLPFAVKGIDSDNDSAFINDHLMRYCKKHKITFTRSRPYKKNDQCHVEQKNWSVVRQFIGYQRFERDEELSVLGKIYPMLSRYQNYFAPMMKLMSKERHGSKITKRYDEAKTPYQRLMNIKGVITKEQGERLEKEYKSTNPAELLRQIKRLLNQLEKA